MAALLADFVADFVTVRFASFLAVAFLAALRPAFFADFLADFFAGRRAVFARLTFFCFLTFLLFLALAISVLLFPLGGIIDRCSKHSHAGRLPALVAADHLCAGRLLCGEGPPVIQSSNSMVRT